MIKKQKMKLECIKSTYKREHLKFKAGNKYNGYFLGDEEIIIYLNDEESCKFNEEDVNKFFRVIAVYEKKPKGKRMYSLKEDKVYNPLMKYPRNKECFCGSKKKFKYCCYQQLSFGITKKEKARLDLAIQMKRGEHEQEN